MLRCFLLLLLGSCVVTSCNGTEYHNSDECTPLFNAGQKGKGNQLGHTHVFRESIPKLASRTDLVKLRRADNAAAHTVVFVVKQKNVDELTRILHDVSDPLSSNYGQHLTRKEVADLTSNPESRDAVVSYLNLNGASVISETLSGEYITANAPVAIWEKMFNTKFFTFHQKLDKGRV